jgi:hypothetical protein
VDLWSLIGALGVVAAWWVGRYGRRRHRTSDGVAVRQRLEDEIERSRRFDRRFEVVRMVGAGKAPPTSPQTLPPRCRRTDRIWAEGNDLYVLLTETEEAAVEQWMRRVRELSSPEVLVFRTACFPTDGLTAAALFRHLHGTGEADEQRQRTRRWGAAS